MNKRSRETAKDRMKFTQSNGPDMPSHHYADSCSIFLIRFFTISSPANIFHSVLIWGLMENSFWFDSSTVECSFQHTHTHSESFSMEFSLILSVNLSLFTIWFHQLNAANYNLHRYTYLSLRIVIRLPSSSQLASVSLYKKLI